MILRINRLSSLNGIKCRIFIMCKLLVSFEVWTEFVNIQNILQRSIEQAKNAVSWEVAPCRTCVNRRFGRTYHLHLQGRKIRERGTSCRLQSPAHAGSSLADFSTRKMEAIRSSETLAHTRYTRRHIPEDGILHSHRCENIKSYILSRCLWNILIENSVNVQKK
jgi:hypothetical protein